MDADGKLVWRDEDDKVQGIVLLRKGEDSLPALKDVEKKVEELNDPESGKLLPGVQIEPYYDRTDLINVTTETVQRKPDVGMVLVTVILLMFLSNVRSALIVAINIPLALLFAFSVLYLRGKSANLLSIGAVDFGIIVDSLGHHGREHLPPPQLRRARRAAAQGAHPARLPRGRAAAVLLDARSWSAPSCRCSPCRGRRARSSGRWPTPTPSPWAAPCCWP